MTAHAYGPPVSVHDVAAYLAQLQRAQSARQYGLAGMATSKLHKLTYFCQAYHLAWKGEPLFTEDVLAAASGPVIAEFFEIHKDMVMVESWPVGNAAALSAEQRNVIAELAESYSFSTGKNMGEEARGHLPWKRAWETHSEEVPRPAISHEDMCRYYRALSDAPKSAEAYAERFWDRYTDTTKLWPTADRTFP